MSYFAELKLHEIQADPNQPRKDFDEEKLLELSESIKAIGVKQPITVRVVESGYMIIAGERRYRASCLADKETIPCVVIEENEQLTEDMIFSHQLSENLHRQELNPVEKAEFIQERMDELQKLGITNPGQQIANELGVSPSTVSKWMGVLKISEDLRALARDGRIRDYSLLKKVDKLKGAKRHNALNQIRDGEFVAKEFFSRKRKKKEVDKSDHQANQQNENSLSKKEKNNEEKTVSIKLTVSELKLLINKTDYRYSLGALEPSEVDKLYNEQANELIKQFKAWLHNK